MLPSVIEHIDSLLTFKTNGITRLEHKDGVSYPVIYSGGGDSEHINFDFFQEQCYHRLIGEIDITDEDSETSGCGVDRTETYPMRLVVYFPNKTLGHDDAYSAYRMSNNIKNTLPHSFQTIANQYGLYDIHLEINSINLDSFDVWNNEFENVDFKVPSNYNLISIDYTLKLNGEKDCFSDFTC